MLLSCVLGVTYIYSFVSVQIVSVHLFGFIVLALGKRNNRYIGSNLLESEIVKQRDFDLFSSQHLIKFLT